MCVHFKTTLNSHQPCMSSYIFLFACTGFLPSLKHFGRWTQCRLKTDMNQVASGLKHESVYFFSISCHLDTSGKESGFWKSWLIPLLNGSWYNCLLLIHCCSWCALIVLRWLLKFCQLYVKSYFVKLWIAKAIPIGSLWIRWLDSSFNLGCWFFFLSEETQQSKREREEGDKIAGVVEESVIPEAGHIPSLTWSRLLHLCQPA